MKCSWIAGWPLMLHLVRLGLGLAIVNGICTPPRGTVARPLAELPRVRYRLLRRAGARLPAEAEVLAGALTSLAAMAPRRRPAP